MPGLEIQLTIPDLWQQDAVHALRAGKDVVVDAPTGAGKTYIFELLHPNLKGQAIYTVPTRALANDKLTEWQRKGWDVGISTGDVAHNLDANVVVATLETQKSRFLRREGPRLLVIDEYQMIGDPVRGVNYELAIALAPPSTQLLLLSGSVGNASSVVDWLRRIGRDALLISHKERPVPLQEVDLFTLPQTASTATGFWPRLVARALHAGLGPILVFAPRRRAAEKLAQSMAHPVRDPITLTQEQMQLAGPTLSKLLANRVAYHHSGLSYALRAGLIEPLAKAGHLDVVVATMGLAAGINFSMRSVLVTDTRFFAGNLEKHVSPDELLQMFGRAGRRGLDEVGYVLTTPDHPRMHNARPKQLRRAQPIDWPSLIGIMRGAAEKGEPPFRATTELSQRLFTDHPIPLGTEHSQATGPMPCGLEVDMERARFTRREVVEMENSAGEWEPIPRRAKHPVGNAYIRRENRWVPAMRDPAAMEPIGRGQLCKLRSPDGWRYGREVPVGSAPAAASVAEREWTLSKWIGRIFGQRRATRELIDSAIVPQLPEITGGAFVELVERGHQLIARIDHSAHPVTAFLDREGKALIDPVTRTGIPLPCRECAERERYCAVTPITETPAHAWRRLGLISRDGIPTQRGVIFSLFNSGEGLAIAVGLEEESYPIRDLAFDLANLRAGHRFAGDDSPYGGRLGILCQRSFGRHDYPGYIEMGVPIHYGAGASDAIRAMVEGGMPRHRLLTDELRAGDIERALVEWRSLLRQIALSPPLDWDRWEALRTVCRQLVSIPLPAGLSTLPETFVAPRRS